MSADQTRLQRRTAMAVLVVVVAVAAGLLAWAAPTVRDVNTHSTNTFWAVSLLALIAEAPIFAFSQQRKGPTRTTLSVAFTFSILMLFGPGPAIVVQAVVTSTRAAILRLPVWQAAFLVGRLVCALGAAAAAFWLVGGVPHPGADMQQAALAFLVPALSWSAVSFGLAVAGHVALGLGSARHAVAALREDILGATALLLLAFPLLPQLIQLGWWTVLFLVPLLAWNQLSRENYERQEVLRREPVTGVLNQRGLTARFEDLVTSDMLDRQAMRPYGIILINIGAVAAINRDLGRRPYEKLVTAAAQRLVARFGAEHVGRFAGEGFVVLLPDLHPADAQDVAVDAARRLTPVFDVYGVPFGLNPAAGVALSPEHGDDLDALVARAELAATQARRRGRLAQVYVAETSQAVSRRWDLLTDLHAALSHPERSHEIAVLYQPQVELATGRLAGVEALLRWTSPRWGPVRPDELIAAIESSEVMHELTAHVLDRVVAQLAAWNRSGFRIRGAANVSLLDLYDDQFPERVTQTLSRHGLPARQLTIEITEGAVTNDPDRVVRAANALGATGVGLSLDDFGTGYASLQQLRQLPLTEVKVDRSYVTAMTTSTAEHEIVTSVHQLARAIGLDLVAEGIEDARTVAALAELPGTIAQGYYFGKPATADELRNTWTAATRAG